MAAALLAGRVMAAWPPVAPPGPAVAVKPGLFSISVADLDRAALWYREGFGFRTSRRAGVPASGLRIEFMELDGFRLELVAPRGSCSGAASSPVPPTSRRSAGR